MMAKLSHTTSTTNKDTRLGSGYLTDPDYRKFAKRRFLEDIYVYRSMLNDVTSRYKELYYKTGDPYDDRVLALAEEMLDLRSTIASLQSEYSEIEEYEFSERRRLGL